MNIDIHLKECATSDDYQHLNSSIFKMQKTFDEYWPKIKDDAIACQLLGPRFKHYTFKKCYKKRKRKIFIRFFLSNDIFFLLKLQAVKMLDIIHRDYKARQIPNTSQTSQQSQHPALSKRLKSLFLYIKDF
jgi:hypothetical protein